jgi:hypothetical protein
MRGTAISNWVIVRSPKLVQARSNEARATINFLLLYQGSRPFTHCATSAGTLRHECWYTAPPVLVHCATTLTYPNLRLSGTIYTWHSGHLICSSRVPCNSSISAIFVFFWTNFKYFYNWKRITQKSETSSHSLV